MQSLDSLTGQRLKAEGGRMKEHQVSTLCFALLFCFAFFAQVMRIADNSLASFRKSCNLCVLTISASASNSNQYAVSSSSCSPPSILLINSAVDLPRIASR